MRRSFLLSKTREFLQKTGHNSCFEVTIFSAENKGVVSKDRSIFIVDLAEDQTDSLVSFFQSHSIIARTDYYKTLDSLENSSRFPMDEAKLEINWRGRLLRYNQDFNFEIDNLNFRKVFFKSYFRLIISKYENQYFGKHDISPVLFSSGWSTAGFDDFRGSISSFINFLFRTNPYGQWSHIDPMFDYVKFFISKAKGTPYVTVPVFGTEPDMVVSEFYKKFQTDGIEKLTDELYSLIKAEFDKP